MLDFIYICVYVYVCVCVYICAFCVCAQLLGHIQLFSTPWRVAHQSPLSKGLFSQEFWRGFPFPPPGELPNPGVEPLSLSLLCCRWIPYHWAPGEPAYVGITYPKNIFLRTNKCSYAKESHWSSNSLLNKMLKSGCESLLIFYSPLSFQK